MNWRGIAEILMFLLIMALVLLCVHYCNRPADTIVRTEIRTDTIIKRDTITQYLPTPTRVVYLHDTLLRIDTIEKQIPIVQAEYQDSDYHAVVSGGYFAKLEQISVFPKRTYITIERTEYVKRKPIVSVVAGVGVGYSDKVRPMVGVMVGVPIWNAYGKK